MPHLVQPYFRTADGTCYYPGCAAENVADVAAVERYDQIAASGAKASTLVGSRGIKEITFEWIDSTARTQLESFWDDVKDGSTFSYVLDDTVAICGDGTECGDGTICGEDADGDAITVTDYTMESTELAFTQGEVYGMYQTTLRMREAV